MHSKEYKKTRCLSVLKWYILMTDYYGALSTSAFNFPGQIQSTIINTSHKSILTRLYTNEKILKNHLSKMLPSLCSPLICPLVGAFLRLSRGVASFWCQVCFRSSAAVNLHFSCANSGSVLSSSYS